MGSKTEVIEKLEETCQASIDFAQEVANALDPLIKILEKDMAEKDKDLFYFTKEHAIRVLEGANQTLKDHNIIRGFNLAQEVRLLFAYFHTSAQRFERYFATGIYNLPSSNILKYSKDIESHLLN